MKQLSNEKLSLSSLQFSWISVDILRQTRAEQLFFEFHRCLFICEPRQDVCALEKPFSDVRTGWGSRLCGFRVVILPHQEITIQPTAFPEGQQYVTGYQRQDTTKLVFIFFSEYVKIYNVTSKAKINTHIEQCFVSVDFLKRQNTCLSSV